MLNRSRGRWQIVLALLFAAWTLPSPASAQRLLADGVRDLSEQIATKAKEQQKLRIAVLPFRELEGRDSVFGTFLAEELFTQLVNSGLEIVERSMLDKVLAEIKLDQTGLIDATTAKRVGSMVGVDAVVTGSITDLQSYVAINCRLIDASTGRIFAAAQSKIVKDDDVRKVMGAASATAGPSATDHSGAVRPAATPARPATSMVRDVKDFRFELKGCAVSGATATCELMITSLGADRQLYIHPTRSRLLDPQGNEMLGTNGTLGSNSGASWAMNSILVSGIPMRCTLRFEGVADVADKATLLEVFAAFDETFPVQFRDVVLTRR